MDLNRLCPGCMSELTEAEKQSGCPHCGYRFDAVEEEQAHRLRPMTVLNDKYVIGKVLGEGGFGITYLGYDLTLEMKIAIKEYYPSGYVTREVQNGNTVTAFTGEREEFYRNGKEKFIKEARTLAKFSNLPGIVSVRDYFEANNTSYIIMEYLDGETLKSYLRGAGGRMPLATVLEMMQPVIRSLEEVHKKGLIHRDISPDNIMILKNGNMKLLDFGAARAVGGAEADRSLSVMLKPGYAPEEQYRTHGNQGPWTDLYAICGTIYKCLTGKAPLEAMERMRSDAIARPSRVGVSIPEWQEAALMKGLALYAEDRYQSLGEFYQAFYLNQHSDENKNEGSAGAVGANQAASAWGGNMNPQDNQFGGQNGMPMNNPTTGQNPYPQQTGNYGMQGNGMNPGMNNMQQGGMPNQQFGANNMPNDQFGMNNAPQNDPFMLNAPQNGQFGMNNVPQNDPFTMNAPQNNDPFTMNANNFNNPQYGYNAAAAAQTPQKKSKAGLIIGAIVVVIIAIVAVLAVMLFGGKDKDKDKDQDVATTVTETPAPTEAPAATDTPAPTEAPAPTEEPVVTEEPTPEPTEAPNSTFVPMSDSEDYRAGFTGYTNENIDFMILKNNQWDANTLIYTDSEKYIDLTGEQTVSYFQVIGDEVYYSSYNKNSETYSFWKVAIEEGATPEQLLDGTQVCAFSYVAGLIFYDNYDQWYTLWCYNPSTGDNYPVDPDNHSLNYYYILNGYIYYECLDDGGMYKMSLDGNSKEYLFSLSEYGIEHLENLTVFDIDNVTFLSFMGDDGCMYITSEDGSAYEQVATGLDEFDVNNDIYFSNGNLYYSAGNGTEVHVLGIEEYLTTDATSIPDTVISYDSFYYFEVDNGLLYIELYEGNNEIKVLDCVTGEEYNIFDFSS